MSDPPARLGASNQNERRKARTMDINEITEEPKSLWHPNGPLRWAFRIGSAALLAGVVMGAAEADNSPTPSHWEQTQATQAGLAPVKVSNYVPEPESGSLWEDSVNETAEEPEEEPTEDPTNGEAPLWEQYWYGTGDWEYWDASTSDLRSDCRDYKEDPKWAFDVWYGMGSVGTFKEMKSFYKEHCVGTYAN